MTPSDSAELERLWKQTTETLREEMASFEQELAHSFAEMHSRLDAMLAEQRGIADRLNTALARDDDK